MEASTLRGQGQGALERSLRLFLQQYGAEEAFAILADLLPDMGVFVVDRERQIRYWSKGAQRLLGFQAEQILGQYCLRANRCASCLSGCGIAERGYVEGARITLYHSDGRPISLRKSGRAFFDAKGAFAGGIEILYRDESGGDAVYPAIPADTTDFHGLWSRSPLMHRAFEIVRNVAPTDTTVLVRGESGTGKEIIARAIHMESHRRGERFLAINCAALTPTLLESELFGHLKGAFTGAVRDHAGVFAQADGGTLFLDEVAELPLALQAKLLRVLQEQSFVPVGGVEPQSVDVRIVAATHQSLRRLVQQGRFREDLMYRLRVVPIFLPALRERREDIELLLWHFLKKRHADGRRLIRSIAPDAMRALLDHAWPGNVRELQNIVDYALAVGRGEELRFVDLPPEFSASHPPEPPLNLSAPPSFPVGERLYEAHRVEGLGHQEAAVWSDPAVSSLRPLAFSSSSQEISPAEAWQAERCAALRKLPEAEQIRQAWAWAEGHIGKAAALLGMSRTTFWRKRKKYSSLEQAGQRASSSDPEER